MKDDLNETNWNQLIKKLTASDSIDWTVELSKMPADKDFAEKLKALESIHQAMNPEQVNKSVSPKGLTKVDSESQFSWGHLQVKELIGEGAYGEVYRAFDSLLNRDVALKLLKAEQSTATKSRDFISEARSLAKVRNRHVLAIHGANMHDGRVGFLADLLSGDTLAGTTVDYASEKQLLHVTHAITDALSAVHEAGLVHGDVKLSNVMSQDNGKITLMDFGAGGEVDTAAAATGSPILMAPELFNDESKTSASDIYALGVMLFKLATDQYPIKADNVIEVMQAHKDQNYESLHALRPDISKPVQQLINQMLKVEPSQRPDAAAIKVTLREIKIAPQRRTKRLLIAGLFSVLGIATLISSWGFFQANEARKVAETEQQKATAVSDFLQEMLESPNEFGDGKEMKVVTMLDYSAENANKTLQDQPAVLATIESALGKSFGALVLHKKAMLHLDKALVLNTELYGPDNQATLDVMYSKASALFALGEYQQSQELSERVIELTSSNPHVARANYLSAYNRLATIANSKGEPEKALSYLNHERAQIKDPNIAANNQSAFNLNTKSTSYFNLGQYMKAEKYAQKAVDWMQTWLYAKRNQHKHQNLIGPFRSTLANTLSIQGKMQEAEIQYRLSLEQAESFYGKDNAGYLAPLVNLGVVLYEQGKYQESLEIGLQAQEINHNVYGGVHGNSIKAGINVANALVGLGRLAEGEQLMRSSLNDAVELAGDESMDALMLEYNLAELLIKQDKYQDAALLSEKNYHSMESVLGEKHPFTPLALSNLATAQSAQKRYEEAMLSHNKAVMGVKSIVGDQHPFYFVVLWNRLQQYHQLDQKEPGIDELKLLLQVQTDVLGAEHVDTLRSQKLLDEWQ